MFKVGDVVSYPRHGLASVKRIEDKTVGDKRKTFYILSTHASQMTLIVPVDDKDARIRPIASGRKAEEILEYLRTGKIEINESTWNKRYRESCELLDTGLIENVAKVYKLLNTISQNKDLSFGERKMLDRAWELLASELTIATGLAREPTEDLIRLGTSQ